MQILGVQVPGPEEPAGPGAIEDGFPDCRRARGMFHGDGSVKAPGQRLLDQTEAPASPL